MASGEQQKIGSMPASRVCARSHRAARVAGAGWLLAGVLACFSPAVFAADAGEAAATVARGDIRRSQPPARGSEWLPLYLGNGRLGTCLGPWGLHVKPGGHRDYQLRGVTHFTHLKHLVRAKYNADYLLPVGSIYWAEEPAEVREYSQHQSFYDGTILTRFRHSRGAVEILSWVDPLHRDLVGFRLDVEGECPPIVIAPQQKLSVHYGQQMEQTFTGEVQGSTCNLVLSCRGKQTPMSVRSTTQLALVEEGLRLSLSPGRHEILVSIGSAIENSAEDSLRATTDWWHATWGDSAWLDLPDETAQKVWVRSLAYTFYSHNDDGFGCSPPNGLTGAGWPFPFPFDSGCRQPLLLWAGRLDAARKWMEFWSSHAEGLRQYTKRIWKRDGIMLPHVRIVPS